MERSTSDTIAITGLGLICPSGTTVAELWAAQSNKDGEFAPCSRFDNGLPAAEAPKIDLRALLKSGQLSRAPLVSQFAVVASHLALEQSRFLHNRNGKHADIGIVYGTSSGPGVATQQIYDDLMTTGPAGVKPRVFQESVYNAPASLISIHYGISGPIQVIAAAGCSGITVLYHAQMMLAQPGINAVIALCSEELCEAIQSGLRDMRWHAAYGADGEITKGGVMGEGAVAMVLERTSFAHARGATILAELAGVGLNNDAHCLAFPDPEGAGLIAAMQDALRDAQVSADEIDMIMTGTIGTQIDTCLEEAAIEKVFGQNLLPKGSAKRSVGFIGGGAAMLEVALAMEALNRNALPASTGIARAQQLNAVMCNAIGLNGQFGAALVRRAA